MPVEINELIIKVTVNREQGGTAQRGNESVQDKEELVREAVEEMLRIADQKKER